jgi:hypothetical protein
MELRVPTHSRCFREVRQQHGPKTLAGKLLCNRERDLDGLVTPARVHRVRDDPLTVVATATIPYWSR